MGKAQIDISVVIVNYKVKEYIANLLNSLKKAQHDLNLEIFVVDNNSADDSIEYLKSRFPKVHYIENKENLGFSKANNQAIKKASGQFTLIINPDTLVSEDTLTGMKSHMDANPECGACGCKILNPDGTFAPESRRSVPSLSTSLFKLTGLNALFPKSKIFNQYYLGWFDEDESHRVPVLSGSFMFWRTDVLKQLEGFDERFFMYGEDIDLCYRISETNFHIEYVPSTSIIHYKGESTRKGDLKYARIFNKALFQFFDKHYSSKYSRLFSAFVYSIISIKSLLSFVLNNLRLIGSIATDLVILNISVLLGFLIRFEFSLEVFTNFQSLKYLWINVLASIFYLGIGSALDLFQSQRTSISNQLKAIFISYSGVALLTFFVRNLAFSRLALIFGLVIGMVLMVGLKLIQINSSRISGKVTGKIKPERILIVGDAEHTSAIKYKIHSRPDWNYEVAGLVSISEKEEGYLGSLPQLKDFVRAYNIDQIFFALKSISYKDMLRQITLLQDQKVQIKLIPDSMDFILGKSNVEYLESIPLVEVGFAYSKGIHQLSRRLLELLISIPYLVLFSPLILALIVGGERKVYSLSGVKLFQELSKHKWKNRYVLMWNVFIGRIHLVGSELISDQQSPYSLKAGITGLAQINKAKLQNASDTENYELYYLQNYSVWLDIDILIKSLFSSYSSLNEVKESSN